MLDSQARLSTESSLATTARETPTHLFHTSVAPQGSIDALTEAGVQTHELPADGERRPQVVAILNTLGELGMTNVLLEGGATTLGSFRDAEAIDEYRVFIAPKVIGMGKAPLSGVCGGLPMIPEQPNVVFESVQQVGHDIAITARVTSQNWLNGAE